MFQTSVNIGISFLSYTLTIEKGHGWNTYWPKLMSMNAKLIPAVDQAWLTVI